MSNARITSDDTAELTRDGETYELTDCVWYAPYHDEAPSLESYDAEIVLTYDEECALRLAYWAWLDATQADREMDAVAPW